MLFPIFQLVYTVYCSLKAKTFCNMLRWKQYRKLHSFTKTRNKNSKLDRNWYFPRACRNSDLAGSFTSSLALVRRRSVVAHKLTGTRRAESKEKGAVIFLEEAAELVLGLVSFLNWDLYLFLTGQSFLSSVSFSRTLPELELTTFPKATLASSPVIFYNPTDKINPFLPKACCCATFACPARTGPGFLAEQVPSVAVRALQAPLLAAVRGRATSPCPSQERRCARGLEELWDEHCEVGCSSYICFS